MSQDDTWVRVASFSNPPEAEFFRQSLKEQGIEARTLHAQSNSVMPHIGLGISVDVVVRPPDAERALEALASAESTVVATSANPREAAAEALETPAQGALRFAFNCAIFGIFFPLLPTALAAYHLLRYSEKASAPDRARFRSKFIFTILIAVATSVAWLYIVGEQLGLFDF